MSFHTRVLTLALASLLVFAACGDDDASGDASGNGDTATTTETALFSDDLESVCRGVGQPRAKAYESTAPGPRLVAVFAGEDPEYSERFTSLPDGWTSSFGTYEQTELVTCINQVSATVAETCTGYEVDEFDGDFTVEVYDAAYEVTLYAATTAEKVASTRFEMPGDGCPSFVIFTEDEPVKPWFESYDDALEAFLVDYVQ